MSGWLNESHFSLCCYVVYIVFLIEIVGHVHILLVFIIVITFTVIILILFFVIVIHLVIPSLPNGRQILPLVSNLLESLENKILNKTFDEVIWDCPKRLKVIISFSYRGVLHFLPVELGLLVSWLVHGEPERVYGPRCEAGQQWRGQRPRHSLKCGDEKEYLDLEMLLIVYKQFLSATK